MAYINREIRVRDIARHLDLRFGTNKHIHCWHSERHQHGDRTASVGVNERLNYVKCLGCTSVRTTLISTLQPWLDIWAGAGNRCRSCRLRSDSPRHL